MQFSRVDRYLMNVIITCKMSIMSTIYYVYDEDLDSRDLEIARTLHEKIHITHRAYF